MLGGFAISAPVHDHDDSGWLQRGKIRPSWLRLGPFLRRGLPRCERCFRHGPRFGHGPQHPGMTPLSRGGLQRLFDGEAHHHHARDDHRAQDDLRCRQHANPEPQDSGTGRGHRASPRGVVKFDPVMIEGMKAPLRQLGPRLGRFLDGAMPSVRPGQRRRSLEIGELEVPGRGPCRCGRWRGAGRDMEQECEARLETQGGVLPWS